MSAKQTLYFPNQQLLDCLLVHNDSLKEADFNDDKPELRLILRLADSRKS